jgi:putative addiction module CopG family antidote
LANQALSLGATARHQKNVALSRWAPGAKAVNGRLAAATASAGGGTPGYYLAGHRYCIILIIQPGNLMNVTLKPNLQKFIEEQVNSGNFRSSVEVLEEAVNRMMVEAELELDDETAAAINRAEAQIDRGEGTDFEQFAAEWRKRLAVK